MLQRLAELSEQAGVLDSDNGLAGEVLDQLDLLVGERAHLLAVNSDCTDDLVILEHGNCEETARPGSFDEVDHSRIAVDIRLLGREIGNVDNLFGSGDPAERHVLMIAHHRFTPQPCGMGRWRTVGRSYAEAFSLTEKQIAQFGLTQPRCVLQHGVRKPAASLPVNWR